jgi:sugar lactone lactonase YvrE
MSYMIRVVTFAFAAALLPLNPAVADASARQCRWDVSTVTAGLGSLENLAFDGSGGMLLSRSVNGAGQIYRMTADGAGATVVDVDAPGGIVVDGNTAYFTTGNDFLSALTGRAGGTISTLDLGTHAVRPIARGLIAPNGLARLPDGGFIVSRNLGIPPGLTRVSADGATQSRFAPELLFTNGLTFDPRRNAVITSVDFALLTAVALIDLDDPSKIQRIDLNLLRTNQFPDDLTVGSDGLIYLATDGGSIVAVDPSTGSSCTIASFQLLSTSVRFGAGPGWDPTSLYVTALDGSVRRLTPPSS